LNIPATCGALYDSQNLNVLFSGLPYHGAYREMAGITQPLHPHLFRHQMLTFLTSKGLSDAQIQLISGHESKKSLEVYQHLSLESVDKAYQDALQGVGI
jgi:integrase/recombinase XerD